MKRVLQFVKTHVISLLCGLVAVGAIVICVLGMTSSAVVSKMKEDVSYTGAGAIKSLRSHPQNADTIAAERQRGELFESEYRKTVETAKDINARPVLMAGVFPVAEKVATPFEFKQRYADAMRVLYTQIDGGKLPSEVEIQEEAQNIEDLRLLEEEQRAEEEGGESGRTPRVTTGTTRTSGRTAPPTGRGLMPPSGRGLPPGSGMMPGGGRMMEAGRAMPGPSMGGRGGPAISTIRSGGEPKYDPVYRARVAKAKSILCYYDDDTFHHSPLEYAEEAPLPEDMWFAQVGLWVQEDVVKAVADLNQEAADQVADADACVQDVPVKRLVFVRVLGYEATPKEREREGRIWFPGADSGGVLSGAGGPSLTGRQCGDQFDVVRFVVSVVVDQRDLLQLIDRISRVNFYQCLSARYEAVDHEAEMALGYFYGTNPVVRATLEFEGYMAREVYQPLMPPTVLELLGIKKSEE
jgi:hypothetical protein